MIFHLSEATYSHCLQQAFILITPTSLIRNQDHQVIKPNQKVYFSSLSIFSVLPITIFVAIISGQLAARDTTVLFSILLVIFARVALACAYIRNSQRTLYDQYRFIKMLYLGNRFLPGGVILFKGFGNYCYLIYFISEESLDSLSQGSLYHLFTTSIEEF